MVLEVVALILAWLVVTLLIVGVLYLGKGFIVRVYQLRTCKHPKTRRCYGDERNSADRRCVDCGKGFD